MNCFSVEVTFSLYMNYTYHIPSSVGFSAPKLHTSALTAILYTFVTQTTPIHWWAGNSHGTQLATAHPDWDKGFPARNGHRAGQEDCFLNPFVHMRLAVVHSNQGVSKAEPWDGHAVCTLQVHPPTSPCPALSAEAEPISRGHCRKWHHKMKVSCQIYPATGLSNSSYHSHTVLTR